jgi:hypothetical protein
MLRRRVRERKEYLYRKALEDKCAHARACARALAMTAHSSPRAVQRKGGQLAEACALRSDRQQPAHSHWCPIHFMLLLLQMKKKMMLTMMMVIMMMVVMMMVMVVVVWI